MIDRMAVVGGVKIRYVDTGGEGVPLFFCSGIGGSLELWSRQLEALAGSHRLVAWDYPGHGLSDMGRQLYDPDSYAAFALALLEVLGLERVIAVGNSLGGTIALRLSGLAPGRIAGLVLVAPAMLGPEVFLPFRIMSLPLLGELMTKPSKTSVEHQLSALFHDPTVVTEDLRAVVWRNVHKPGAAKALLATLRRTMSLAGVHETVWRKSLELLEAATCPVLLVHGKQDVVLPFQRSEQSPLPVMGQLVLVDACGHTPQFERAEYFNDLLATFARRVGRH
ncbi:alpha/beta fold hydrolase [Caulobacter sp. BK020]|uniref:alpha/beta fold hydrolase n=1 Tax=Caulobacter sp. BK020 TaxID=2512117 RepID=UPI0010519AE5|nr:alpha/beta fold hydrolase [Caulobacter sp. BK020]TCS09325.1 pimeloyl-ACP methyl ester carboxylesterase [Caulobacter sp. BK020]